ncbi:MAG: hypothetical protein PWR07_527 [Bacillota bacterium]|nr:hypothetical protein [Bacillota bacterium]
MPKLCSVYYSAYSSPTVLLSFVRLCPAPWRIFCPGRSPARLRRTSQAARNSTHPATPCFPMSIPGHGYRVNYVSTWSTWDLWLPLAADPGHARDVQGSSASGSAGPQGKVRIATRSPVPGGFAYAARPRLRTRPGARPVCSPRSITGRPATSTQSIPTG